MVQRSSNGNGRYAPNRLVLPDVQMIIKNTEKWLQENDLDLHDGHLYMRPRGDHRADYIAKEIILDFEILTRFTPLMFIDDRKQVVDLWRSRGYTCLACHEGDF